MIDKLVDECTETVEEKKPAIITLVVNEKSCKCSSCTVYAALFWIFFTINAGGIVTYFVYFYWYLKKVHHMLTLILTKKQRFIKHINGKVKQINIKNRTYYLYNDMINIKDFDAELLKIDKKS